MQLLESKAFVRTSTFSKVFADFLLVHTCLIFTLIGSWIRLTRGATESIVIHQAHLAIDQYWHLFLPLSLIFPAAFVLSGTYKDHTGWAISRRAFALGRGIAIGLIVFVPACLLFVPGETLGPRSLAVLSASLIGFLGSARLSEWAVLQRLQAKAAQLSSSSSQPVLIIGGAGYIGSILVQKLLAAGRKVRVLDSLVYGDGALRDVIEHPNLEVIVGDCRNLRAVVNAVNGVDAIVHLAAIVGDPACAQNGQAALETNYAATRLLIEVAKGHGIKRFLFASSCSVYGATEEFMGETSTVHPISLYAQTKVDSEQALLEATGKDFQPTILRLATVFGLSPRPRFDLVVNLLSAKASQGDPVSIFNGEQWRPFIHVEDVAQAFVSMLNAPLSQIGGEVFNVGDTRFNYTLTQVAEKILKCFPEAKVEHAFTKDRRNYRVSFDKILQRVGFQCAHDLDYGIQEIRDAFTEGRILDYTSYQYNNQKFLQVAGTPTNQDESDEVVMAAFAKSKLIGQAAAVSA